MFDWFWKFFTIPKAPCDRPDFEYVRTIHERVEHSVLINGKPVEGEEAERISAMVHEMADDVFEKADLMFESVDRMFDAANKMFDDLGNERNKDES